MAEIKKLQVDGADIYPVTHESAVYDNEGKSIESKYLSSVAYTQGDDIKIAGENGNVIDTSELEAKIEEVEETANWCRMALGDGNQLLTNNKNSVVEAINELFQSANNGKELIADAIGEPLDARDTFSAMSNDIKSLLSTFKTNLMNSGVAVNGGDKFKQLIDKIKGLTEGEGNKGIQYGTGAYSLGNIVAFDEYYDNGWTKYYYQSIKIPKTSDLNFIYVYTDYDYSFIDKDDGENYTTSITDCIIYDPIKQILSDGSVYVYAHSVYTTYKSNGVQVDYGHLYTYVKLIDNTDHVVLPLIGSYCDGRANALTSDDITYNVYYTIGLGEEDTTLRDSLASILQEEGVEVSEEDDMASLIAKVDTKLDNSGGGLDIITATELPSTGKEGQLCILTETPASSFLISNNLSNLPSDGVLLKMSTSSNFPISVTTGNITTQYLFDSIHQNGQFLESYFYTNNQWNKVTKGIEAIFIMNNGVFNNTTIFGGLSSGSQLQYSSSERGLVLYKPSNWWATGTFANRIDFSDYTTLTFTAHFKDSVGGDEFYVGVFETQHNAGTYSEKQAASAMTSSVTLPTATPKEYTFDISSWDCSGYLGFAQNSYYDIVITNLTLTKE